MNDHCRVLPLDLGRRSVRFRWELGRAHPAWRRGEFTLEYEDDVDLTTMPRGLLWTVFLGCTHPIWSLLDGYEVEFVEPIDAAELGFWVASAAPWLAYMWSLAWSPESLMHCGSPIPSGPR